jgi:hypothetical protein
MRVKPALLLGLLAIAPPTHGAAEERRAGGIVTRTSSGRPDLSGTYDIASLTPMQRDPKYGDRVFLTAEEAAEIENNAAARMALANRDSDPNREAPPAAGDGSGGAAGGVGGYNAFAIDGKYLTSILVDPEDGRLPPLTEAGKRRREAFNPYFYENNTDVWWLDREKGPYDGPESVSLLDRCLYTGVASVPAQPVLYNNLKTIVQTDTHVVILVEWMHWARIIRLDAEHHPPEIRSLGGDSIGRWEGETLVVDTTNFLATPTMPREGLHVVERFTRLDQSTVLYQFTVNDPDYAAPYGGEFPWHQTTDKLYEYACHEGNYALGNILRGARLMEKEALVKRAGAHPAQD